MIKAMMKQMVGAIRSDVPAEQVKAAVNGYLDSWRNGDAQARVALFADNAVVEDPVGADPIEGKTALLAFWQRAAVVPTVFTPTLERLVVCGNEAMVAFSLRISVTGLPDCTIQILENFKIDKQGKIRSLRAFWDEGSLS